jgi:hypothetical protein
MATLGAGVKWLGYLVFAVTGILSFILELKIIYMAGGFGGFVLAFLLGPITLALAPFYAGIAWGYWFPLILGYGGGIVAFGFIAAGGAIAQQGVRRLSVRSDV